MRRSQLTILALTLAIGMLVPATAAAELPTGPANRDVLAPLYTKMKQRFTTRVPGASTGWVFDGVVTQFPEGEQVPPQRVLDIVYPRGTKFDLKAAKGQRDCTATDEDLITGGVAACPSASQVGAGNGTLFLGLIGTWNVDVSLFAARPGFVLVERCTPKGSTYTGRYVNFHRPLFGQVSGVCSPGCLLVPDTSVRRKNWVNAGW